MATKTTMVRIKLKAYDHKILDESAKLIVENKDSREQFEQRTHKRIIDVYTPSSQTMDDIGKLDMPAGVSIEVKIK